MESFIFYKIPYEGSIAKIKELFNDREWNLQMKVPKVGILLVKIPLEIDEEIVFNQGTIIDEETNTKFGTFEKIIEKEFEEEKNIVVEINEEKESNINKSKKNQNFEYKRQMSEILLNEETLEKEIPKKNKFSFMREFSFPKINLEELKKKIELDYKDPYDYFLSKNYLIMCFILAIICLILFNF